MKYRVIQHFGPHGAFEVMRSRFGIFWTNPFWVVDTGDTEGLGRPIVFHSLDAAWSAVEKECEPAYIRMFRVSGTAKGL
jgi:hypothetical protein